MISLECVASDKDLDDLVCPHSDLLQFVKYFLPVLHVPLCNIPAVHFDALILLQLF